ncbi:uncharacterized protein LOC127737864 [Mytilus californianus]|uniref:uncharacterized protein LOC127737864 n=1 Tax=Mytilus californianus TaxID=6549 RepID=UPI0022475333|nr:uncharacterized protein LOC127737864 [Mytilus californianus]XP_052104776.1 uncharacterized protein LOC127737864 [Mytilus californianus]
MKKNIIRPTIIVSILLVIFLTMVMMKVDRSKMVTQFLPFNQTNLEPKKQVASDTSQDSWKNAKRKETYKDVWTNTNRSLTVVTAFFNLGKFPKGSFSNIRTPESYKVWMSVYKYLKNPLIIYTDSKKFADFFTELRNNSAFTTKIIIFSRDDLWTFHIKPQIAKLYSKPGYPKHYPNTYIPDYTCMTHSKLTLVAKAINSKLLASDYYSWIDLGYFRDISSRKKYFYLEVPTDFDNSKVGVTQVYNVPLKKVSARSIILGNKNWIGGGLFLGKPDVLKKFESQYKDRVLYYLSQELMNVEQHILYSMYTAEERKKNPITVEVQPYLPGKQKVLSGDPWFYLGFLMYNENINASYRS